MPDDAPAQGSLRWLFTTHRGLAYLAAFVLFTVGLVILVPWLTRDAGLVALVGWYTIPTGLLGLALFLAAARIGHQTRAIVWFGLLTGIYLLGAGLTFAHHELVNPLGQPPGDPRVHLAVALVWPVNLLLG